VSSPYSSFNMILKMFLNCY